MQQRHIWYYPEYNADYHRMDILKMIAPPIQSTLRILDIECSYHDKSTLSIDLKNYDWRMKWFTLIPMIKQIMKNKHFFQHKKTQSTPPIRVILYHTEMIRPKEWVMFLSSPFRIDVVVRSLASLDKTFLSKCILHRIPAKNDVFTWKEHPWKASAERMKQALQKPFKKWRDTRDILYEWMLFDVNYEEAVFDVFQLLETKSLSVQMNVLTELLSLLSLLSMNQNREVMKPTIRATTSQHTFYILERCILIIATAYAEKQNKH